MKAIVIEQGDAGGSLVYRDVPDPVAGPDDLLVAVRACALNRADVIQRMGGYPQPGPKPEFEIPGLEYAGEVLEAGARVEGFAPGDRVMGLLPGGGYAERVSVPQRLAVKVPGGLGWREAGATPEVFITAHDALLQCGLQAGERVLVHAVGSGVGVAAVQIAKMMGASLVIGIVGFTATIRAILKSNREKRSDPDQDTGVRPTPEGRGDLPIWLVFIFWFVSTTGFVVLLYILIPDFPWWISAIFGYLWSPVFSYIGARMIGITGSPYGTSFPFVKEASFLLSGYKGVAVWFAPIPIFEHGKVAETFKQLDLTKTTFGSVVKLTAVTTILMFICSFIFYSLVWKLNPIPSSAYPYVQKMWPLNAAMRTIWVKSTLPGGLTFIFDIIKIEYIIAGLGITGGLFGLLTLAGASPLFFYGLVGGMAMPLWQTLPTFFGAILGRYYFSKRFGEEKWMSYVPIVLAGYGAGIGLIGMIAIAIALISKAISQIVY